MITQEITNYIAQKLGWELYTEPEHVEYPRTIWIKRNKFDDDYDEVSEDRYLDERLVKSAMIERGYTWETTYFMDGHYGHSFYINDDNRDETYHADERTEHGAILVAAEKALRGEA